MTTATENTVALTIRDQIKMLDRWAMGAWGVKMLVTDDRALHLVLARGLKIIITLNALDLYDVVKGRTNMKKATWTVKDKAENIYAEDLVRVIDGMLK